MKKILDKLQEDLSLLAVKKIIDKILFDKTVMSTLVKY